MNRPRLGNTHEGDYPTCLPAEKVGRGPCRLRAPAAHDDAQSGRVPVSIKRIVKETYGTFTNPMTRPADMRDRNTHKPGALAIRLGKEVHKRSIRMNVSGRSTLAKAPCNATG